MGFPGDSVVKNPSANAGNLGSISGSGRSPGGGNGNPLQYSCLGNPMDRGALWATIHGVAEELDVTQRLNDNNNIKNVLNVIQFIQFSHSVVSNCLQPHGWQPASSSLHGILQARILQWVVISSSKGSSQSRDRIHVSCISCIASRFFTAEPHIKTTVV